MKFFQRKKKAEEEKTASFAQESVFLASSEANPLPSLTDDVLASFAKKAEEVFEKPLADSLVSLELDLSSAQRKPTEKIPDDRFSVMLYMALNAAKVPTPAYLQFIKQLEKREGLEDRLKSLNVRISRLTEDIRSREELFDEAKLEDQFASLEDDDEDESEVENTDMKKDLQSKREALKQSFVLLSQLEMNRAKIHKELISILVQFNNKLPKAKASEVLEARSEIKKRIEELENIKNVATSDGEKEQEELSEEEMLAFVKSQLSR